MEGLTRRNPLLCPSVTAHCISRGNSAACESVSPHTAPARSRVWLVTSTGFTVVSGSQCHESLPSPARMGCVTQTTLGAGGGHSSQPWPGMLTTPAGVQKLQLKPEFQPAASPSSISQDPSDTKTLTGPGMRMLCQRSWLRARNAPQRPFHSP